MLLIKRSKNFKGIPLIFLAVLLSFSSVDAQEGGSKEMTASVQLKARAQENQILLRWAVDRPGAWKQANTYGFYLYKYVYMRDGKRVQPMEKVTVLPIHIQAAPLETWEEIVKKDNYAAIIAQSLFGQSFEVTGNNEGGLARIINTAHELEQRFSFGLFAADMNFEAAVKAGWGYVDTDVKPNEEYVYQIKTAIPADLAKVKSTAVTAGTGEFEPLPAPIGLQGIWGDENVLLTWDYSLLKSIYTSYNVERSEDGKIFETLSPVPLVNLNDSPEAPARRMYYTDSLAENNKMYYYRVYGLTPFGEKGPVSEVVQGKGRPTLMYTPRISRYEFTSRANEALIFWEYPKDGEKLITKFILSHAEKDSGPYEIIMDSIPVRQRETFISDLAPSNYLKISAVSSGNQRKESFSVLIQPIDSVPPQPPTELMGSIDSLGLSRIKWARSAEKDLLGYRVFRANHKNEEFVQLTVSPIKKNEYTDSVQLKSLNSKVLYRIIAVDKRYNQSSFSDTLILVKPDVVPPSAPIFSDYKTENGKVYLEWKLSSENEVIHYLYRKNLSDDTNWKIIFTTTGQQMSYTDTDVIDRKTYRYAIMARDKAGLESEPSTPLTVTVVNLVPQEQIRSLEAYADREGRFIELVWRLKNPEKIAEVTILRNKEGEAPVTYKILPPGISNLKDRNVSPNNTYIYTIRTTMKNGSITGFKSVAIKY